MKLLLKIIIAFGIPYIVSQNYADYNVASFLLGGLTLFLMQLIDDYSE